MQCMVRLICSPPEAGQYDVVNQVSGLIRIKELAETVAKVSKDFGINTQIQRVENPRVEADKHPLEVVSTKLPNAMGFTPNITFETEIKKMFELLTQPEIKTRIEEKKHVIMPKTRWDGVKQESETFETYNPGTKNLKGGYKGVLHTKE